jgi:hypothetical protein
VIPAATLKAGFEECWIPVKAPDLAAAEDEHREALAEWHGLDRLRDELEEAAKEDDGTGRMVVEPAELALVERRLREAKERAAERLIHAREQLARARVAAANEALPGLVEEHAHRCERAERARLEFEHAYCKLLLASWEFGEALQAETLAARTIVDQARSAAPDTEAREHILSRARHSNELPALLGPGGPLEWTPRPGRHLFDGIGDDVNPGREQMWSALGVLANLGRERGLATLGETIRARVQELAEERGTDE